MALGDDPPWVAAYNFREVTGSCTTGEPGARLTSGAQLWRLNQLAALAAEQRPITTEALNEESGVPAWKTIPSWAVVGPADHVIPPASQLTMANNAGAKITEIDDAPHL